MFQDSYCGVYLITVMPTGHFYIGSAGNMPARQERHLKSLQKGNHHNKLLQQLYVEHGKMALVFSVIQQCVSRDQAYLIEAAAMEASAASSLMLNIGKHSKGGDNLSRHPNRLEVIARTRATLKKQIADLGIAGRKAKYGQPGKRNGMYGRTHAQTMRDRVAEARKGNQWSKGRVMPLQQRQALSEAAKLRTGLANGFFGRAHTQETKDRMRQAKLDNPVKPASSKRLKIGRNIYPNIRSAMQALSLSRYIIKQRLADPAFPTYKEIK